MSNISGMPFSYDEIRAYADSCSGNKCAKKSKSRFRGENIAICGSMKFAEEMREQEKILTKEGYTVLMPIMENTVESHEELELYRRVHKRKIGMADSILVINKDGYVDRHTADEIEAASQMKKYIYFLENANDEML